MSALAHSQFTLIRPDAPPVSSSGSYTIGMLAKTYGLTPRAIRFYCDRGLIRSDSEPGRFRIFDRHNVERLTLVEKAKALGFSLREIETHLMDKHGRDRGPVLKIPNRDIEAQIAIIERRQAISLAQLRGLLERGQSSPEGAALGSDESAAA